MYSKKIIFLLSFLIIFTLELPYLKAQTIIFQGNVSGVSTDGNGVSTPYDGSTNWYKAEKDFIIQIPTGSVIKQALLAVIVYGVSEDIAPLVRFNGITLDNAGAPIYQDSYTRIYDVTNNFNIKGSGTYTLEEMGKADKGYTTSGCISGEQLVVFYDHPKFGKRHVIFVAGQGLVEKEWTISTLPTVGYVNDAILSVSIWWETSCEQNGSVIVNGLTVGNGVGGRDDGKTFTSCSQDWNSLFTVGSFGYDDRNMVVGLAGDSPDKEPANGNSQNSRLSDELWRINNLDKGGVFRIKYGKNPPTDLDSALSTFILSIEMDIDADNIIDSVDNCPEVSNPDQSDRDIDGVGDLCDGCPDDPNKTTKPCVKCGAAEIVNKNTSNGIFIILGSVILIVGILIRKIF